MVIENSSKGYQAKKESDTANSEKLSMAPSTTSTSSRQWAAFRNPRIVRVSRALGGKDRHSKVCTIRGLRDRRIRLSVPTAIQLYDLQDRLGLSQPSKVIDWLIEASKLDIDKLPPLQIPHGFPQFHHQQTLLPYQHFESSPYHHFSLGGFYDANLSTIMKDGGNHQNLLPKSRLNWDLDSEHSRIKGKETESVMSNISQKGKWIKTGSEQENQDGIDGYNRQKIFPGLLNNAMAYDSYHSEPSSLSLSQFGGHGSLFPSHVDPHHHQNSGSGSVQFSSSNAAVPSGSQLLFSPSSATPSLFTPYAPFMTNPSVENDPRQFNHVQILSSSSNNSQLMQPHPLNQSFHSLSSPLGRRLPLPFNSKLLDSDNNNNSSEPNKGSGSSS